MLARTAATADTTPAIQKTCPPCPVTWTGCRASPAAVHQQYQPVTAAAHGQWRGKVVAWERVFSNRCALQAATGSVFRF